MTRPNPPDDAQPVVHLDATTLLPVGVSAPCRSTEVAHLGFSDPSGVRVPCGLLAGHDGPHVFHIEWSAPSSSASEPMVWRRPPRLLRGMEAMKCDDCGHLHIEGRCSGPPTPSDLWAGVSPSVCDCNW